MISLLHVIPRDATVVYICVANIHIYLLLEMGKKL